MSIIDEIKDSFRKGTSLNKLIYLNIGIFLLVQLVHIGTVLSNAPESYESFIRLLAVPSGLDALKGRFWTVITYMFFHKDFFHILFNMILFFWFGRFFMEAFGEKKLMGIYILGGIGGAILYIAFYNLFPFFEEVVAQSVALGASASVIAVVMAVATYVPERRMHLVFIGPVKIIYVALFFFIISSVVDFSVNTGGKIAHMGGAVVGVLFALYYKQGKDITRGFDRLMDTMASWFKPGKSKMKVTYRRPADDMEYNRQKAAEQKEVDRILEKISKAGYDSLTKREKEMLFKMKDKS